MKHSIKLSLGISAGFIWLCWYCEFFPEVSIADAKAYLGLLAQISATMLGFLLAALAILASITSTRLVRNMQKTGHYGVLLRQFFINAIAYMISMLVSLVAYWIHANVLLPLLFATFSFLFACCLLADVGWRFWLVMTHLKPERNDR